MENKPELKWDYDPEADCAYIQIRDVPFAHSKVIDDGRLVDYAPDGTVIGIELICIRYGVDVSGLPYEEEVAKLLREHDVKTLP